MILDGGERSGFDYNSRGKIADGYQLSKPERRVSSNAIPLLFSDSTHAKYKEAQRVAS